MCDLISSRLKREVVGGGWWLWRYFEEDAQEGRVQFTGFQLTGTKRARLKGVSASRCWSGFTFKEMRQQSLNLSIFQPSSSSFFQNTCDQIQSLSLVALCSEIRFLVANYNRRLRAYSPSSVLISETSRSLPQSDLRDYCIHSRICEPSGAIPSILTMAEVDSEMATLRNTQVKQEDMAFDGGDGGANGVADGEQPSNTEIIKQEKKETVADDQVLRALPSSASVAVPGGGDDPSLLSVPAVTVSGQESRSSSRASTRKPKTIGGFIADDSEEEYDAATPEITTSLQPSASNTPTRNIAPSPLQNSVSQEAMKATSQNDSSAGATSHTLSVNPSIGGVTPGVQTSSQVLTSAAPVASAPKARLPHDKAGILEDRIQEDPRGDVEAWLALIAEYRSRNKLDDARAVYHRFFKVFPQAVSSALSLFSHACSNFW